MKEIYQRLARHIDDLPVGFPATESGLELKILQRWFTPEEAEIALGLTGMPEPVSAISERLKVDAETLSPLLEAMSRKGLIFRVVKGDARLYQIVPLAEGMWEFHLNSIDKDDVKYLHEYIDQFMEKSWYGTQTSQHRIIPIAKGISAGMEIMPYEKAEEIIKSQSKISAAHCICRREHAMIGQGCDHPSEVCLAFGTGAYYYIENGLGREISKEEALSILHMGMEAGLVLQPGNGRKTWSMCMCCSCACYLLKTLKKMEKPAHIAHTNFYASVDEDICTACGICVDRCPMEAIELADTAVVNRDRCIGCGVCVVACDVDAMVLHPKKAQEQYLPPRDIVDMQRRIAQERGAIQENQ